MVFWKALMLISLTIYAVLVLLVTVGGLMDIASMFRTLDRQHKESAPPSGGGADRR